MRILTLILFFSTLPLQSQIFFDAGLKGGWGGAFLINSNVLTIRNSLISLARHTLSALSWDLTLP